MTKDILLSSPSLIREIANSKDDARIVEAYALLFDRDISRCPTCIKTDASFYLHRRATNLQLNNNTMYKLKKEHVDTISIGGIGVILPLDEDKVLAIQVAGFGYILEEISDTIGEVITPVIEVIEITPVPVIEVTPVPVITRLAKQETSKPK